MIATLNKSIKNPVLFNYSFIFMKSKNEFELFTSDLLLFKKLKRALSPLVVQHTFKEDFLVNRMIGKGSFAKVYLAKKKEDSKNYAVKAFNKDFLTNNAKNGKVIHWVGK